MGSALQGITVHHHQHSPAAGTLQITFRRAAEICKHRRSIDPENIFCQDGAVNTSGIVCQTTELERFSEARYLNRRVCF